MTPTWILRSFAVLLVFGMWNTTTLWLQVPIAIYSIACWYVANLYEDEDEEGGE